MQFCLLGPVTPCGAETEGMVGLLLRVADCACLPGIEGLSVLNPQRSRASQDEQITDSFYRR